MILAKAAVFHRGPLSTVICGSDLIVFWAADYLTAYTDHMPQSVRDYVDVKQ